MQFLGTTRTLQANCASLLLSSHWFQSELHSVTELLRTPASKILIFSFTRTQLPPEFCIPLSYIWCKVSFSFYFS